MTLNEYLIQKANPYHAKNGRFTSADGRGSREPVHITKPKEYHSEKVKQHFASARSEKAKNIKEGRVKFKDTFGVSEKVFNTDPAFKILRETVNKEKELLKEQADLEKRIENKRRNSERNSHKDLVRQRDLKVEIERNNQLGFKHLIRDANWNYKSKNKAQKSELLSTLATIYRVKKANPYKDESGKWTSKDKAKSIAEWFYEGGKEQIKRTSAGLAGAAVGGSVGAVAGSLAGLGLAAAGSSYLTGAAAGLTSIPLLGESLSGLAKASAPTAAGIATGAALGSMAGLGVLGIGAGAYLGAKTAGAAVGGYLGAKGGYEVGTALYDSNLSEKIEEWKSNAKDKASAQTDKLKDTVKARVGDLKNKASKEFDAAKQKANAAIESKAKQLKEAAKSKADQAKELIKQKANEAKNKAKAAATSKLKELAARYKPIKKYDLTALRNA